jgi:hypothetical protein
MACKTRRASLRRAIQSVTDWCRRHRHLPVQAQHAALRRRLRGHFNYFGVSGNFRSLLLLVEAATLEDQLIARAGVGAAADAGAFGLPI